MARALDNYLLNLVTKGRPVVDGEGFPVKGEDGKPVYRPPSAADLKCISGRLKDCDVKAGDAAGKNGPAGLGKYIQDVQDRGHHLRMAGSDEAEAATG